MNLDKSLSFGIQNFLFCKSDETDVTYDYVGYITKKGSVLIGRYNKAGTEAKYYIEAGDFDTVFAKRALVGTTYQYPNKLVDQKI